MNLTCRIGDCLEVMKHIPDGSVDMILTDPPYGTTQNKWDSVIDLEKMWGQLWRVAKPNGAVVMTAQPPFDKVLGASQIKYLKYEWIWRKEAGTGFLNSKKQPLKDCENILVFYRKQCLYTPQMRTGFKPYKMKQGHVGTNYGKVRPENISESNGDRYPLNLIEFPRDKDKKHPTQKPVPLMEYLIKTYTLENETVLDFTMGSGTTGVACKNLNRKFIGIELDPDYFNIARGRIT